MDWLLLITSLIEILAWPVVVVISILMLRRPLLELIPRLRIAKYKDFEFRFSEKLELLGLRVEQVDLPEVRERPAWVYESPDEWTFSDYIERIAPMSPKLAISEAWRQVEFAIQETAKRSGKIATQNILKIARELQLGGILPQDAVVLLNELKTLRDLAIRENESNIESDHAVKFGHIAEKIIASINYKMLGNKVLDR